MCKFIRRRLMDEENENQRMLVARMACCFGIRIWHLGVFSETELKEIIRLREYNGIKFDYPNNPIGGVKGRWLNRRPRGMEGRDVRQYL